LPAWQSVDNVFPDSYLIRVKTEAEQEKENMRRTDIMMTAVMASKDKESGIVKDNETLEAEKVSRLEKMETKKREIDETVNMLEALFPAKPNK
jgi:Mg/Co/Ni transporter MgtE